MTSAGWKEAETAAFTIDEDRIDIQDLLQNYDPLTDALENFFDFEQISEDIVLKIDQDGAGNIFSFEDFVSIENVETDTPLDFVIV